MLKILVIEEDSERQHILKAVLMSNHYELVESADPGIAWTKLLAGEKMPDLIICSYPQAGLSEFLQKKHGQRISSKIPIIFLMKEEEKSNPEEIRRGPKHPYWFYLAIPFNPSSLLGKIEEMTVSVR
ncbi:MAG: response regulator [Patescibacteria group bacterium]